MATYHIIILLATGLGAGFAGGLLGLGGAFIMTPVQYIVFTEMGLPIDLAIKLAFGTSLMVVLPTAISGAWRHHRAGGLQWRSALIMGVCGLVSALAGATLAARLPGEGLRTAFGVIVLIASAWMLSARVTGTEAPPVARRRVWVAWALPIGFIAGVMGIGGGIMLVPVLALELRFRLHDAIGMSLAVMIFISVGGFVGYIINGLGVAGLPEWSVGYVYLPAWLLLAATSTVMVQIGALAAGRISARWLKYIFVVVMLYMGLKMIGVFEWLGWPL